MKEIYRLGLLVLLAAGALGDISSEISRDKNEKSEDPSPFLSQMMDLFKGFMMRDRSSEDDGPSITSTETPKSSSPAEISKPVSNINIRKISDSGPNEEEEVKGYEIVTVKSFHPERDDGDQNNERDDDNDEVSEKQVEKRAKPNKQGKKKPKYRFIRCKNWEKKVRAAAAKEAKQRGVDTEVVLREQAAAAREKLRQKGVSREDLKDMESN